MKGRTSVALLAVVVAAVAATTSAVAAAPPVAPEPAAAPGVTLRATSDEPRSYGYRVGDLVRRHVVVEAPAGSDFDPASLPPLGRHGTALELRDLRWRTHRHLDGGHRIDLTFDYQVFVAPKETRVYALPAIALTFRGPASATGVAKLDAWPVSVAPLTPLDTVNLRGLGDFRPDARAPSVSTASLRWQLAACAALVALLCAYLLHVYVGLPWRRARQRPFAMALRGMKHSNTPTTRDDVRMAFRRLHSALNQTAGGVLFAGAVDRFVAAHPAFAPLHADLRQFFAQSDAEFFAATDTASAPTEALQWLTRFARRCRDAESGRS